MNTSHLKQLLIKRIESINDEVFLNALKVMTDSKIKSDEYRLSNFEQEKIRKAQEQYRKGEISSQDEIEKDIDEWLKSA
jgi:hypothetical protein